MAGKIHSAALALAIATIAAAPGMITPVLAQQIGTATAVNPSTDATPPGGATTALTIGAHVLHKERIHTSASGSVQLLFLDKSTLSIAPNTSLVIDEFVYDPASNSGHMLTKLTQGTLEYIGGQLSHQGAVTINTPAATIGIRGGIGFFSQGPKGLQVGSLNGSLGIQNGATPNTTIITGYMVDVPNWNTPPGPPYPIPPEIAMHYITVLSSTGAQTGSGPPLKNLPTFGFACGTHSTPACPQGPWQPTNTGENDALQLIIQATQLGSQPNPPPPPPPLIETGSRTNLP